MGDEKRDSEGRDDLSDYFSDDDFVDASEAAQKAGPEPDSESELEPETEPEAEPETKSQPASTSRRRTTGTAIPGSPEYSSRRRGAPAIVRYGIPVALFLLISLGAIYFSKPSGEELLTAATESFGKIERGVFDFQIAITPRGSAGAQPASISLTGPFELPEDKKLPNARIEYTIESNGQQQTVTLILTGDKAYTEVQGQAYELPPEAVKQLEEATKDLRKSNNGSGGGLAGINLNFDEWLSDPEVVNGGKVGGQKTWQIDAKVDVVAALTDLLAQAKTLGSITGQQLPGGLKKEDAAELRKSIKSAFVRVNVGRYDDLLRRFDLSMDVEAPSGGKNASPLSGGRVNVVVGIDDPNKPVKVEAPPNPLPYSALESLGAAASGDQQGR